MQKELVEEIDHRSVYAKPLPFDCTLEGLQGFFSSLGGIKAVRMRRRPDNKDFKGSVFVEMDSPQLAAGVRFSALKSYPHLFLLFPYHKILHFGMLLGSSNFAILPTKPFSININFSVCMIALLKAALQQLAEREDLVFEGAVLRIEKKTDYLHRKKEARVNGTKAITVKSKSRLSIKH